MKGKVYLLKVEERKGRLSIKILDQALRKKRPVKPMCLLRRTVLGLIFSLMRSNSSFINDFDCENKCPKLPLPPGMSLPASGHLLMMIYSRLPLQSSKVPYQIYNSLY